MDVDGSSLKKNLVRKSFQFGIPIISVWYTNHFCLVRKSFLIGTPIISVRKLLFIPYDENVARCNLRIFFVRTPSCQHRKDDGYSTLAVGGRTSLMEKDVLKTLWL